MPVEGRRGGVTPTGVEQVLDLLGGDRVDRLVANVASRASNVLRYAAAVVGSNRSRRQNRGEASVSRGTATVPGSRTTVAVLIPKALLLSLETADLFAQPPRC